MSRHNWRGRMRGNSSWSRFHSKRVRQVSDKITADARSLEAKLAAEPKPTFNPHEHSALVAAVCARSKDTEYLSPLLLVAVRQEYRLRTEVDPLAKIRRHPKQEEIFACGAQYKNISGANRGGKSHQGCDETLSYMLGQHPSYPPPPPNGKVWICGVDYKNVIRPVLLPMILSLIPKRLLVSYDKVNMQGTLTNGVTFVFKAYESGVDTFQSDAVNWVFCDEMPPDDIMGELETRILTAPGGGMGNIIVCATPLKAPKWYGVWRKRWKDGNERYAFFQMTLWDNAISNGGYIPDADVAFIESQCPKAFRACRIYGHPLILEQLVYKEWPMAFTEDPPIDWPLYDAIDPAGGGKTGYLIASVDPGGGIWIVDEYLEAARDITQHAASIKEKRKAAIDRGYKFQGTLIDPKANRRDVGTSIDERSKEWLTVRVQYRNAGIPTRLANK